MCCNGSGNWKREEVPDHKFDFIDVREYHTNGIVTQFKYVLLYLMVIISFAVYVADIYTAITLLVLGHFTGNLYDKAQNNPENNFRVPIAYGKWIFFGCIIFSFLLLAYEAHKSRAIIKSKDISYAYTNIMANNYYSLRSYDHFCFFCQINNSKKKKDEFAFFIFFTFKGWKTLLVADGPRQVINAFTLYGLGTQAKWSTNPYDYYQGNVGTGLMILTMLFTVTVFAASFILLIIASVMYIPLLCYIKGNLKEYCCHKIDKRISELVKRKKKLRLMKQAAIARKEAAGDFSHLMNKKGQIVGKAIPQPTLPIVDVDLLTDDKPGSSLHRNTSVGSSTVHGTTFYGDKTFGSPSLNGNHFYGVAGMQDYSSTVNLIKNAGPGGGDGSLAAPTLPPSVENSPDSAPVRFHGMDTLLSQMGPIGTSPMLLAQRVGGGGGRVSPLPGGAAAPDMYPQQGPPRALINPLSGAPSPGFGPQRMIPTPVNPDSRSPSPFQPPQRFHGAPSKDPYANSGLEYPPPKDSYRMQGLKYPPPQPPHMSSFVPYGGVFDQRGNVEYLNDEAHHNQTGYNHPSNANDGRSYNPEYANSRNDSIGQQRHVANRNSTMMLGRDQHSPNPSVGGYEDVYDAYLLPSRNPSQSAPSDRKRESYYAQGNPTAGLDDGNWNAGNYHSDHQNHFTPDQTYGQYAPHRRPTDGSDQTMVQGQGHAYHDPYSRPAADSAYRY